MKKIILNVLILGLALVIGATASANSVNVLSSLYGVTCTSTFEGKTTLRVQSALTRYGEDDSAEELKLFTSLNEGLAVYTVQTATLEIDSDLISIRATDEEDNYLDINIDTSNVDAIDGPAEIKVNGTPADFLKLTCSAILAG